jgi:DNA invertase Pin-like site-specific DNA recombinase
MSPAHKGRFVAYYRVSTDRQGRSGLGLDAQRTAVTAYLNGGSWELVGEFVEVETGKRGDRLKLAAALEVCRKSRATLVIAKLDRLARNTKFLLTLLDSGVNVLFCDLPQVQGAMGRFLVTQMASVAELEAGLISERTKAALKAAKARGTKLGNPRLGEARERAKAALKAAADQFAANVAPIIREMVRNDAMSNSAIAAKLNERNVKTARGGRWTHGMVRDVMARATTSSQRIAC